MDLEGTLVFPFITVNTSDVPTAADATPTYKVYAADLQTTLVSSTNASALSGETGGYYVSQSITAAGGFESGKTYAVLVTYAISSAARRQTFTFTVA